MQPLYVDDRDKLVMLYPSSDTSWTAHCVSKQDEDAFATVSSSTLGKLSMTQDNDTSTVHGHCSQDDGVVRWDDGTAWRPLTMSCLQHKCLVQRPYVPMTFMVCFGIYNLWTLVVSSVGQRVKAWRRVE